MKKLITRYCTAIFPFLAFCTVTFAQTSTLSSPNSSSSKEVAYLDEPKSLKPARATDNATASINSKAVKDFKKSHQNQSNANWFALSDGFVAQFKQDGITTKVYYDKKGHWTGDVRTYFEENLPKSVRHQVKSTYYDFDIVIVNEVRTSAGKAYLVKIEDETSIKTLHVQDDEMTETEAFQKSK